MFFCAAIAPQAGSWQVNPARVIMAFVQACVLPSSHDYVHPTIRNYFIVIDVVLRARCLLVQRGIPALQRSFAGRYVFESVMEANAVVSLFTASRVTEISRGRIEGSRFVPEYYRYEKNSKKKDYELSFDYATNVVMRSDNGPAWRAEMPDQLLDKLSYQGQMITDVAANPQTLNYTVADRGKLKDYDIRNLGVEDVETTLGKFRSIKLQRGDKNSKRQTTVWFAEELGWMPVKVEYRDKKGGLTTGLLHTLNSGD